MSQKQHETEEMISLIDFRQASAALFLSVMVTFPCLSDSPVEALLALKHAPENIALEAVVRKSAQLSLEDRGIEVVTLPEDVAAPSPSAAGGILAAGCIGVSG